MFERLKKTTLGKAIYRFSRWPVIGWPVRALARFVQSEVFQPSHLYPANIAHNRQQSAALKRFEEGLK